MDLLNWAEDCYNEDLSKGRKLPFELIRRILIERREAKAFDRAKIEHNRCMAQIVTLFKEALVKPDVGIDNYCYSGGDANGLWEDYVESIDIGDDVFNNKFDLEEDWIDEAFGNCFANWFVTTLNTNLGSHPSDNGDGLEWYDGRYMVDTIWRSNRLELVGHQFWQ